MSLEMYCSLLFGYTGNQMGYYLLDTHVLAYLSILYLRTKNRKTHAITKTSYFLGLQKYVCETHVIKLVFLISTIHEWPDNVTDG